MAFRKRTRTGVRRAAKAIKVLEPGGQIRQTTVVDGKRVVIVQAMDKDGNVKTKMLEANVLESDLQAAQVSALKGHKHYGKRFTLAGDMGAGKRGPKAIADALRTGLESGEPDLRLYFQGGRLVSIENKAKRTPVSPDQIARHALLRQLGFEVHVIKSTTEDEATRAVLAIVDAIL